MKPELAKDWKYWEGFADGQRDMEKQIDVEKNSLDPNQFIGNLDTFTGWVLQLLENNGSNEVNEEGGLAYQHYGPATMTTLAMAFAQARLLRVLSACIFRLNQGDFTEEQFHHEIEEAIELLDKEAEEILG